MPPSWSTYAVPKTSFSDQTIRSLQAPPAGQLDFWDAKLPGFGCRVSQAGTKTFVLKHKNRRVSIGRYPIITLADARAEAKRLLAESTLRKARPGLITYADAVKLFLEDKGLARRHSTVAAYKRRLNRLGFKGKLTDITHDEAARKVNSFKAQRKDSRNSKA